MLEVKNISIELGEFSLKNVSMQVNEGEYMVVLGPTGAGKTILLETIAGIYIPRCGRIFLNGKDITTEDPKDRKIAMVYQDFVLFPHLSVYDNIAFGLKNAKKSPEDISKKVDDISDLLGISHLLKRSPVNLSGGEKQRTAIARAIVMEPEVLLLDEPLSALDGNTREKLRKELKKIHQRYNTKIIHVTHNFEEVFSLADRVSVMNKGEIIQTGIPDEVFSKPNCRFIAGFVGVKNIFRGVISSGKNSSIITVDGLNISSYETGLSGEIYASVRPEDIMISKAPLETPARNSFRGTVESITNNGTMVQVRVDVGISFQTVLTRRGFYDIEIKEGDSVYLTFKAAAVHVFS
ncbi:molybdate transport system ATP-binding protein/molybdate/tungstate transport system ATP-binding protein [Methanomicrobium sp. W14]|uniref:tungstate ABC transporter ATP-binding protein WtpC n=1 Tax=Methanomicrobium sp. W14 TaxID=2817839 RepID=UPI001AE3487F|nr:tungstate ABC transporter ATP-binding protein WtpC [Methanomicrobium sp. W14]MBP2134546.1 molybdate transport system ATP-binding protein/molybdate/tungstate transport system ATP-binding protein [Methanomicrobium sp. W14]